MAFLVGDSPRKPALTEQASPRWPPHPRQQSLPYSCSRMLRTGNLGVVRLRRGARSPTQRCHTGHVHCDQLRGVVASLRLERSLATFASRAGAPRGPARGRWLRLVRKRCRADVRAQRSASSRKRASRVSNSSFVARRPHCGPHPPRPCTPRQSSVHAAPSRSYRTRCAARAGHSGPRTRQRTHDPVDITHRRELLEELRVVLHIAKLRHERRADLGNTVARRAKRDLLAVRRPPRHPRREQPTMIRVRVHHLRRQRLPRRIPPAILDRALRRRHPPPSSPSAPSPSSRPLPLPPAA